MFINIRNRSPADDDRRSELQLWYMESDFAQYPPAGCPIAFITSLLCGNNVDPRTVCQWLDVPRFRHQGIFATCNHGLASMRAVDREAAELPMYMILPRIVSNLPRQRSVRRVREISDVAGAVIGR